MARFRRFTQGVLLAYLGQIVIMFAGLWLTPFLLRQLGQKSYGLWIAAQQCLIYLSLIDLGVVALLPRDIAWARGRGEIGQISALVSRSRRAVLLQSLVLTLLAALVWRELPVGWGELRELMALGMGAFIVSFPLRVFRATLEGLQDLGFIGWSYLIGWTVGTVVTAGMVFHGNGLSSLAVGWAANQASDAVLCYIRLRVRFSFALTHAGAAAPIIQMLRRGLWLSLGQIAQVLTYGTDALVIGRIFGAAAIVPYACTGKLIAALANQPQAIMRAAEPGLAEMRTASCQERLTAVTSTLGLAMLLVSGLVSCVTLAINPSFVRWWVGPQRYAGLMLSVVFTLSMLLRHINVTAIYALFAFGHERRVAISNLVDGILSTSLSILLGWRMHSVLGVALGAVISTACVFLFCNAPLLGRELNKSPWILFRPLLPWVWRMLPAGAVAVAITLLPGGSGLLSILAKGLLAGITYLAVMFPVAWRSPIHGYVRARLESIGRLKGFSPRVAAATR